MAEYIGPLNRDFPVVTELEVNGNPIRHYMDMLNLPEGDKRAVCAEHLRDGRAAALLKEFLAEGCHFPEPDDEQIIRTAFVCPGPSALQTCRLRLLQADRQGNVIAESKLP